MPNNLIQEISDAFNKVFYSCSETFLRNVGCTPDNVHEFEFVSPQKLSHNAEIWRLGKKIGEISILTKLGECGIHFTAIATPSSAPMKRYDRVDGIPAEHLWMLVRILSYADQGGARYQDEILYTSSSRRELKNYCLDNGLELDAANGWNEYAISPIVRKVS